MNVSVKPIGGSSIGVAILAGAVLVLTIWAYQRQLRGTSGAWRWVAFGLRIAAVILCLLAALRPSLLIDEKKKQQSAVLFLIDSSASMAVKDEAGARSRWEVARQALDDAKKAVAGKSADLEVKVLRFDADLRDDKPDDAKAPDGRETQLGSMLLKAVKDAQPARVVSIYLLADGASNAGISPLVAAQQLRAGSVPVVTVGVGTADAGKGSKDLAAKDLVVGPTVFVKNQPEIRATLAARGFAGQTVEVEMFVEGERNAVATKSIKVPPGAEVVPITGLRYIPQTPGEKLVTLKVKPEAGELVTTNNEVSTYLDVLKGGIKVLYVHGSEFSWEPRFLTRALDAAKEIHVDLQVITEPARGDRGLLDDALLATGGYDVFILGGLAADYLTRNQASLLQRAVERGAGLIMLGGRTSFGDGGWGSTDVARVLPVIVGPNDGALDPEDGLKVVPDGLGLESFVTRLAANPADNARIWADLPPITGTNRFRDIKPAAFILARSQQGNLPLMIGMDNVGRGRSLAFGGETWPWARGSDEGRAAQARFWRQAILWLARKEDSGENTVKLKLDARRVALGQKLELSASARDPKNEPIADAQYEASVVRLDANGRPQGKPEVVPIFPQGEEARGPYFASGQPGQYQVTVKATKGGKEIGQAQSRFMAYQDDRELANPAADLALLRQISEITGGVALKSEELAKHLKTLGPEASEYITQAEFKVWDNWPFFLVFATLLSAEWALRKAKGWV